MNKKALFLFVMLIIISTSCNQRPSYPGTENSITEFPNIVEGVPSSGSETKDNYQESNGNLDIEKLKIYGTWSLDKIVLTSKDYIGEMGIFLMRRSMLDMKSSILLNTFV